MSFQPASPFPPNTQQTHRAAVSSHVDQPVTPALTPFHSGAVYDLSFRVTLLSPSAYSSLNLTSAALNGFSLNGGPRGSLVIQGHPGKDR